MPPLLAAQLLFGDSDRLLVAVNFGVKALQRLPHLLHPLQQQLPLLNTAGYRLRGCIYG